MRFLNSRCTSRTNCRTFQGPREMDATPTPQSVPPPGGGCGVSQPECSKQVLHGSEDDISASAGEVASVDDLALLRQLPRSSSGHSPSAFIHAPTGKGSPARVSASARYLSELKLRRWSRQPASGLNRRRSGARPRRWRDCVKPYISPALPYAR